MDFEYHHKILRVFSKEELELLMKNSVYSFDIEGLINVIVVLTNKLDAEIFTDCEAKEKEEALIVNLNQDAAKYYLSKKEFWEIFITSKPEPYITISLDE